GPIYGKQWRRWYTTEGGGGEIDQIDMLVRGLKSDPLSRRHVVSAWNVADLPADWFTPQENAAHHRMALAPCHVMFQCYVQDDGLSLHMYQRSADLVLGVPFNIASYALLMHLLAKTCGLRPRELIISYGDVHLYSDHLTSDIVYEQLSREPRALPHVEITKRYDYIDQYTGKDIVLTGYNPHPGIKAKVSV
ncbi:MAG: thymidylate synthase, partial [bacterium]